VSRTRRGHFELGEAVSIESALTVLVVILLVRLLIFIPLVNIDRMKLEQAQKDTFWKQAGEWITAQPVDEAAAAPYVNTFGLQGQRVGISMVGAIRYIEGLAQDSVITVIMHDPAAERYIGCIAKESSTVVTYRIGSIHWSGTEKEWFTANNSFDYGENEVAAAMQKEYRRWSKETRGF
jgi:hypothetical protein